MSKVVIGVSASVGVCAVIVIIVLLACSYAKVEMTDVALLYSHAARRIDRSQVYTAGRYYVGVGGEFITFPITLQELALPVFESRTRDGLKIKLEISLSYKIENNEKKIFAIFDAFGSQYDGFLSRLAMNIIRDASAQYDAFDYAISRSQVSQAMESDVRDDMSEIGFSLESLQLLNIEFPSNFSATLANTLMLEQQVSQAKRDKAAELVSLEGELSKSNITASGIISDAMSEATTIQQKADADAEALILNLEEEGQSHKKMIDMFKEMDPGHSDEAARALFVKWYWMNKVSASPASKNIASSIPSGLTSQ